MQRSKSKVPTEAQKRALLQKAMGGGGDGGGGDPSVASASLQPYPCYRVLFTRGGRSFASSVQKGGRSFAPSVPKGRQIVCPYRPSSLSSPCIACLPFPSVCLPYTTSAHQWPACEPNGNSQHIAQRPTHVPPIYTACPSYNACCSTDSPIPPPLPTQRWTRERNLCSRT